MTFGLQKDDKITFCCRCFIQGDMQKRQFQKDGVRRVDEVSTNENISTTMLYLQLIQEEQL